MSLWHQIVEATSGAAVLVIHSRPDCSPALLIETNLQGPGGLGQMLRGCQIVSKTMSATLPAGHIISTFH
jgi:hypothetical protein